MLSQGEVNVFNPNNNQGFAQRSEGDWRNQKPSYQRNNFGAPINSTTSPTITPTCNNKNHGSTMLPLPTIAHLKKRKAIKPS